MLYEYAMTPDLFDSNFLDNYGDPKGTILVEVLRGLAECGVLANLNRGGWVRHVKERANTLSPEIKDKVFTCLEILDNRNRLVRHPKSSADEPPCTDCDWLKLALVSHNRIPFHAINLSQVLIDNCKCECSDFVEYSVSLDSLKWEDSKSRTQSLIKTKADYRTNLAPVLRYAKKLALIDPYMNCTKKYINTISICSNLLGDRGHDRLDGQIELHALEKQQNPHRSIDDCLAEWEKRLQSLANVYKHRFQVFLWESKSQKMHDRYLLTEQCGLSIPRGLDCEDYSPNSTDWSLLDEGVRQNRWADYDKPTSPFELKGTIKILP